MFPIEPSVVHTTAGAAVTRTSEGVPTVTARASYHYGAASSSTQRIHLTFDAAEALFNDLRRALYGGHV